MYLGGWGAYNVRKWNNERENNEYCSIIWNTKNSIITSIFQDFPFFNNSNPIHICFKTLGILQDYPLYTFISFIRRFVFYNKLSTEIFNTTKTKPHQAGYGTQHSQQFFNIWGRCHNFQCLLCNRLCSEPNEPGVIILTSYI